MIIKKVADQRYSLDLPDGTHIGVILLSHPAYAAQLEAAQFKVVEEDTPETREFFAQLSDDAIRDIAKREHVHEGTLEIDPGAVVSRSSDGGAYVQSWVWVYLDEEEVPGDGEQNSTTGNPGVCIAGGLQCRATGRNV